MVNAPWLWTEPGKYTKPVLQREGHDIGKKEIIMHIVTLEILCNISTTSVYSMFTFVSV